jgi:hypothetical protein
VRNSRELKIVKQAKKYIIFCFVGMWNLVSYIKGRR